MYIFRGLGLASHRWCQLSSNVRLRTTTMSGIPLLQSSAVGWRGESAKHTGIESNGISGKASLGSVRVSGPSLHSSNALHGQSELQNQQQPPGLSFDYSTSLRRPAARSQEALEEVSLLGCRRATAGGFLFHGARRAQRHASAGGSSVVVPDSRRGREFSLSSCVWSAGLTSSTQPNPSLKRSPNGGPPGPATGYGVHSPVAGPGVPPSVPA